MAALKGPVKVFIAERLGAFEKPTDIQHAVKQVFKVDVTLTQILAYNPTLVSGRNLGKMLREVFESARTKAMTDISNIPIANRGYRLRVLQRVVDDHDRNPTLVMSALEQAAKEEGGNYTNRLKHEHTGKDGGPIETKRLTDAERASRVASIIERARQRAQADDAAGS